MTHRAFVGDPRCAARYWARSIVGWPRDRPRARPNAAHRALAALQHGGQRRAVVTQNVDGLHQRPAAPT